MSSNDQNVAMEMPNYLCTKKVWALKIQCIEMNQDGSGLMGVEDKGFAPVEISKEYIDKHNPQCGGYYVVYQGGYKSFSPADAFESGYERLA